MAELKQHKEYIRYSKEQLERLRETDMVDFLSSKGYTMRSEGGTYRCKEHNSLVISSDRKRWYWNSRNIGGNNVIDWFASVEGIGFQDCCKIMIGKTGEYIPTYKPALETTSSKIKKKFIPPECLQGSKYSRVYVYLTKSRCINSDIVKRLFKEKLIYQEAKYGNCVFAGYDENGHMRFAERRTTSTIKRYDDKGKEMKFRQTVAGSDCTYGFHIDADVNSCKDRVYIFEAPIDLLSHATLVNIKLKNKEAYRAYNYISLSGVSDIALAAYLERNKDITTLVWCLDNDIAGQNAVAKYTEKYAQMGYKSVNAPVSYGKDYNELLCEVTRRMHKFTQSQQNSRVVEPYEEYETHISR